jgi:hypothetical protein
MLEEAYRIGNPAHRAGCNPTSDHDSGCDLRDRLIVMMPNDPRDTSARGAAVLSARAAETHSLEGQLPRSSAIEPDVTAYGAYAEAYDRSLRGHRFAERRRRRTTTAFSSPNLAKR